ncbi:hypothetical protein [Micromonospora sp. NPDC049891]|uniref:hypothetical protein n=1 Tax=Micromonospora sp. NPDC049891 TaxID=3155655 RepID=UPI00340CF179
MSNESDPSTHTPETVLADLARAWWKTSLHPPNGMTTDDCLDQAEGFLEMLEQVKRGE